MYYLDVKKHIFTKYTHLYKWGANMKMELLYSKERQDEKGELTPVLNSSNMVLVQNDLQIFCFTSLSWYIMNC